MKEFTDEDLKRRFGRYGDHFIRTTDPDLSPEDLDRILDLIHDRPALMHGGFTCNVEEVRAARNGFRRFDEIARTPDIERRYLLEVVEMIGVYVGFWNVCFGYPLKVPLQRILVIPEEVFRDAELSAKLLQGIEKSMQSYFLQKGDERVRLIVQGVWVVLRHHIESQVKSCQPPPVVTAEPAVVERQVWWVRAMKRLRDLGKISGRSP